MSDDFLDGLDREYAPGWTPEAGDVAQGIVVAKSYRDGTWGPYPILTIRRILGPAGQETLTSEELAIHCGVKTLKDFVEEQDPQRGDRIAVRYDGMKESAKGTSYAAYRATIQRGAEIPAHLRLAPASAAPAAAPAPQDMPF